MRNLLPMDTAPRQPFGDTEQFIPAAAPGEE